MPCRCCSPGPARSCWINSTATVSTRAIGSRRSPRLYRKPPRHLPEGRGLRILEVGAGHRRLDIAGAAATRARSALLHLHRRLGGIFPRRDAEARRRFPRWNTRFSISRNRPPSRTSRRDVRFHHRHQRASRGQRRALDAAASARTAGAGRQSSVYGHRDAAVVDRDSLWSHQRLVEVCRSRSASAPSLAGPFRSGRSFCARPALATPLRCLD